MQVKYDSNIQLNRTDEKTVHVERCIKTWHANKQ